MDSQCTDSLQVALLLVDLYMHVVVGPIKVGKQACRGECTQLTLDLMPKALLGKQLPGLRRQGTCRQQQAQVLSYTCGLHPHVQTATAVLNDSSSLSQSQTTTLGWLKGSWAEAAGCHVSLTITDMPLRDVPWSEMPSPGKGCLQDCLGYPLRYQDRCPGWMPVNAQSIYTRTHKA